jgi:hypothetical protein
MVSFAAAAAVISLCSVLFSACMLVDVDVQVVWFAPTCRSSALAGLPNCHEPVPSLCVIEQDSCPVHPCRGIHSCTDSSPLALVCISAMYNA